MRRQLVTAALAIGLGAASLACQRQAPPPARPAAAPPPATPSAEPAPVDFEQLARRLVTQNAAVKTGELVLITGRMHDAKLLESIAVHVRKVGGFPLVEYSSDCLSKRLFFDVPAKHDAQAEGWGSQLAGVVDVVIGLANSKTENLFEGADPKRMAARGKAAEVIQQAFHKHNVRMVEIGSGLYPTAWRAKRFGMAEDELAKLFWDGINLDYIDLQVRAEQVKAAIAAGNAVRLTHPNGTDLTLRVQGRPVLVSDGIISADDIKRGGANVAVYLPAGEVYTTPVPGTAQGKIVDSRSFYRGKQVDNLTLTLADGKVIAMSGSGPGYAGLKAEYDAVDDPRKDLFGYVDLGINPNVALPATSTVGNWVPAGTVTVGTGGNVWAGGDNSVPYGTTIFLPGSTLTLDGETIVENGVLKL